MQQILQQTWGGAAGKRALGANLVLSEGEDFTVIGSLW